MKIRTDFVSNSSSCSFVIDAGNVKNLYSTMKSTFSKDDIVPYEMEVMVLISAKNRDYREVEIALTGQSNYKDTYQDYKTREIKKKDPEEIGWDRIRLELGQFMRLCIDGIFERISDKIASVEFECDDCEYAQREMLSLLYSFFERHGCKPNCENSEHEFIHDDQSSFLQKLQS